MKIRKKVTLLFGTIVLPVLAALVFVVFNLQKQERNITADLQRVQKLNSYIYELGQTQDVIDRSLFSYRFRQDNEYLENIASAKARRLVLLDGMAPLTINPRRKSLIEEYRSKFQATEALQTAFVDAIDHGSGGQINSNFDSWQASSANVRAALDALNQFNITSLQVSEIHVGEIKTAAVRLLSGVVGLMFLLFVILYRSLRKLVIAPIAEISQSAEAVIQSGFKARVLYSSSDEIGDLARSFNGMSAELEALYHTLELKVAEKTLELQKVSDAKTDFVSLVSHQLKTPLSILWWYATGLEQDPPPQREDVQRSAKKIKRASERLLSLVNNFLNISRIELGIYSIEPEQANVVELVQAEVSALERGFREKNIVVRVYSDPEIILPLDTQLMQVVISNVLSNALQYVPVNGKINIVFSIEDEFVIIAVTDDGVGIPESSLPRIGEKLYRAENAKEMYTEGTGLGAYIVASILRSCGGNLVYKSPASALPEESVTGLPGTTCLIYLPRSGMSKREGGARLFSSEERR